MKALFTLLMCIALCMTAHAQRVVAVQSGSDWTFYDDFSPALRVAPSGATIYVPGGSFSLGTGGDTINKTVTIIGAGFYPDSSSATNHTVLDGSLYYANGADNTILMGIDLTGGITVLPNSIPKNTAIDRCRIRGTINLHDGVNQKFKNVLIRYSILTSYLVASPSEDIGLTVSNCIISDNLGNMINGHNGASFLNNIIIGSTFNASLLYRINNSNIENNVIISTLTTGSSFFGSNSFIKNNYFRGSNNTPGGDNNSHMNNISGATLANTFENVTSSTYSSDFNYRIKAGSPALTAASDGGQVGIYGGYEPVKDGWIPTNPHIFLKNIASSSSSDGTLPVQIGVAAQDR